MSTKKWILTIIAAILLPVLIFAIVCLTRINMKVGDYEYSPELPKPGIGVDFGYDDLFGDLYVRWCNLLDNTQTALWKAPAGITKQSVSIPARDGCSIPCYVIVPAGHEDEKLPTMLYCHGGAFFLTMMTCQLDAASVYAEELQCRVVLPQYRISFDAPYPTPLYDCYDTLKAIAADPKTDADHVLIYGDSAGGCLAASVTQLCCDEGLLAPAAQMLIYPVTDNKDTYPDLTKFEHAAWPHKGNTRMWKRYLNGQNVTGSDYAVPMLHETLSDLPKTYVHDVFLLDEAVASHMTYELMVERVVLPNAHRRGAPDVTVVGLYHVVHNLILQGIVHTSFLFGFINEGHGLIVSRRIHV